MIDTVCLLIPKQKMVYDNKISNWDLYAKTEQYEKYVRNPSKAEKETGKYFPRLTGYKRRFGYSENVKIEFSVPKLLYLNNLDEVDINDFDKVIEILRDRLKEMGIMVFKSILENASVSSVHFSKNTKLHNGFTASYVISELSRVNLRKSFDFAKTRFINNGESLYAHTTSHQFVIYDKMADLKKGKKRAVDKDQTLYQKSLFESLSKNKDWLEVIRFEVRINHKQKLNSLLKDLGYEQNPKFKDLFENDMSKKVLMSYWDMLKEGSFGLFAPSMSIKKTLEVLLTSDRNLKPKQAIYLLGLFLLGRDGNGITELRRLLSFNSNDRTWYRVVRDIKNASNIISQNMLRDWVIQIDQSIKIYKPYKREN